MPWNVELKLEGDLRGEGDRYVMWDAGPASKFLAIFIYFLSLLAVFINWIEKAG